MIVCFLFPQFGIACERARLTQLWGQPLALTGAEGSVLAISEEAQRYGIRPGQTGVSARALCQTLVTLPYDRPAYETAAHCVWDLLAMESSFVEPVSPELCFIEMVGADTADRAGRIALALGERIRITVGVGLAKSKLLARQAAQLSREGRVEIIPLGLEDQASALIPIAQVGQIDARLCQEMHRLGLHTLGDLRVLPPRELPRRFRQSSLLLARLARGDDGDRVRPLWPPRHVERRIAFEDEVADEHTLCAALGRCAERIGRALRAQREYCRSLTLTLVMADGSRVQQGERLAAPLDEAGDLCRAAIRLFRRVTIDKPLLEVCLDASELGFGSGTQLTLLDEFGNNLPGQRQCRLDTAVAFIRKRFGVGAIVTAGRMRKARRVRLWTYSLGHLMDEAVEVVTDAEGIPVRYWRRGRRYRYEVKSVQNRWREAEWFWDTLSERTIYRVETDPPGLAELYRIGDHWRLGAVAD